MDSTVYYAIFILIGTFISSVSQVLLKKSAEIPHSSRMAEYFNPYVITAYIVFFIATFLSVLAYKGIPASMGPVLEATSYIYVTIFGVCIFHEHLTLKKILALVFIIGGICVYSI